MGEDRYELIQRQRTIKRYRRGGRASVGTGTISLLMIFTVLCFATLSLLSLSTAASDRRIQQRGFERTVALAAAEGRAAEKLAALDGALLEWQAAAPEGADYAAGAQETAAAQGWAPGDAGGTWVWTEAIDSDNDLVTTVEILPAGYGARCRLIGQSSAYVGAWEEDPQQGVWMPPGDG